MRSQSDRSDNMSSDILYVIRDRQGQISSLNKAQPQSGIYETLPANHPDILNFIAAKPELLKNKLSSSDADFIRVLDDLIEILIDKDIVMLTDFHERAQEKIHARLNLRGKLNSIENFLNEDVEEIVL